MRASESPFESYKSKANFVFRLFTLLLSFRSESAKNNCLPLAKFNCSEKLQNIFDIGLKKCGVIVQKSLSEKKYLEIKEVFHTTAPCIVKLVRIHSYFDKIITKFMINNWTDA